LESSTPLQQPMSKLLVCQRQMVHSTSTCTNELASCTSREHCANICTATTDLSQLEKIVECKQLVVLLVLMHERSLGALTMEASLITAVMHGSCSMTQEVRIKLQGLALICVKSCQIEKAPLLMSFCPMLSPFRSATLMGLPFRARNCKVLRQERTSHSVCSHSLVKAWKQTYKTH